MNNTESVPPVLGEIFYTTTNTNVLFHRSCACSVMNIRSELERFCSKCLGEEYEVTKNFKEMKILTNSRTE